MWPYIICFSVIFPSHFFFSPSYVCSFSLRLLFPRFCFKPFKLEECCTASSASFTNSHPSVPLSACTSSILCLLVKNGNSLVTKYIFIQLSEKTSSCFPIQQSVWIIPAAETGHCNQISTKVKFIQATFPVFAPSSSTFCFLQQNTELVPAGQSTGNATNCCMGHVLYIFCCYLAIIRI